MTMKRFLILIVLMAFIIPFSLVKAQTHKFGHLNTQAVIVLMPEYKKAEDSLRKRNEYYAAQEKTLQSEIQNKINEFQEDQKKGLDSLILQSRYAQLQSMNANLEQFQQGASEKLQKLNTDLINAVVNKLFETVKQIAVELDLTYVFDTGNRNPIYASEKSVDLLPMVKEKLKL
jgi:outer membrane protein